MNIEAYSYQEIIENLHDGLYFVDRNRIITYWNKAAEKISGFRADEVVGKSCADNVLAHVDSEGNSLCTGTCPLEATIEDGQFCEADVYMHHKDGHRIPVSVRASALSDKEGKILGAIELFTDISHQTANELRVKELEKMALYKDEKLNVTISIGATLVKESDTIESLTERADAFLYDSKAKGRNCLTMG